MAMSPNEKAIWKLWNEAQQHQNPQKTQMPRAPIKGGYPYWLTSDNEIIYIDSMTSQGIYDACIEVIEQDFKYKDEWLKLFYQRLKETNENKVLTKLMLKRG